MMPLKKLPTEFKSTDELISTIELKDRKFRIAQTVFMVTTLLALIVVLALQQRVLRGVQDQLKQAEVVAERDVKNSNKNQETTLRRLDCMAVFFSKTDRTNLTISDIDKCTLNAAGDVQTFFTEEGGETQTTRTEQPSSL